MNLPRKKLLILAGIGLGIVLLVIFTQGIPRSAGIKDVLRLLCDGVFVAGALLLGTGGLVWGHAGGVTDGLGFSMKTFLSLKWKRVGDYKESFSDYRARREARSGDPKPYLIIGGGYFLLALLLFAAYSIVK